MLLALALAWWQIHANRFVLRLTRDDAFPWQGQEEREADFLAQFQDLHEPSYYLDPPDWLSGVWQTADDEAEQRRPRIPADPLFAGQVVNDEAR